LAVDEETFSAEHYFRPYKSYELAQAHVHVEIEAQDGNFLVSLDTDVPALWLALNAEGIAGEFDDNCFTLLPDRHLLAAAENIASIFPQEPSPNPSSRYLRMKPHVLHSHQRIFLLKNPSHRTSMHQCAFRYNCFLGF
jgi:hypothetical protein